LTLLFCWVCSDCWFIFGIKFWFHGMMSTMQIIALVHQFGFFFWGGYSNYCHVVDCMIAQFVDFIWYKWAEEVIVNISSKLKHPIISQSRIHSSCLVSSWERCKGWTKLLESFRSHAGSGWNDASIQMTHGLRQTMEELMFSEPIIGCRSPPITWHGIYELDERTWGPQCHLSGVPLDPIIAFSHTLWMAILEF
jgi:hypothetical protein